MFRLKAARVGPANWGCRGGPVRCEVVLVYAGLAVGWEAGVRSEMVVGWLSRRSAKTATVPMSEVSCCRRKEMSSVNCL